MYGIEISYSNGVFEERLTGNFKTKEEAFVEMCKMAAAEVYISCEEFPDTNNEFVVFFNSKTKEVDVRCDNNITYVHYRIKNKLKEKGVFKGHYIKRCKWTKQ